MPLLVEFIGRYLIYLIFALLLAGLLFSSFRQSAFRALLSAGLSAGIGWFIKDFFYLPRPFILSGREPFFPHLLDGSLPSVHTAISVAIAVSILLRHRRLGIIFMLLALLVAAGRVAGGVHSYLDIISGAIIGSLSVLITVQLENC